MSGKRILQLACKALCASPKELRVRLQQAVFAAHNGVAASRGGSALSSRGHLRSLQLRPNELADWWKHREVAWFIDENRVAKLQAAVDQPDTSIPWVLKQADIVVDGCMPMFSYQPVQFHGADRWHHDFILKKTAPRDFYGHVKYLDAESVGDSKHIWEPNRFSWALWLGIASLVSSEQKYADKFFELTEDWFEQNPYPMGINYCSSLELAFRNYAWLWSLRFFSDQFRARPELLENVLEGIWIGCRHIEANLSTYFSPNTHILGEAFGLFVCGAAVPEFKDAKRWRELGGSILAGQATRQFHADGTHAELSSVYHLYSTDFCVHASLVGRETNFALPASLAAATRRMSVRLSELAPTNLQLPQFNDCDGGRLTSLVPNPLDAGPTLIAADSLFDDITVLSGELAIRGYPLLMASNQQKRKRHYLRRYKFPCNRDLSSIYDSGLATWKNADGDFLLFRASPFGYHDCPHSHDAGLGILLHLKGVPILVDSGVGSYTQSASVRNEFRSAKGKNTLLIDGRGPSVPEGWFSWSRTTDCELVSLRKFEDGITACGKHSGYSVFPDRHVFVQREVTMLHEGIVAVVDRWDSDHEISAECRFTLHPELHLDSAQQMLQHSELTVHFCAVSLNADEDLSFQHGSCPFSQNYGHVMETTRIAFKAKPSRRGGIVTIFSRLGKIHLGPNRAIQIAQSDFDIRLHITDWGVEPTRSKSKRSICESEVLTNRPS